MFAKKGDSMISSKFPLSKAITILGGGFFFCISDCDWWDIYDEENIKKKGRFKCISG